MHATETTLPPTLSFYFLSFILLFVSSDIADCSAAVNDWLVLAIGICISAHIVWKPNLSMF